MTKSPLRTLLKLQSTSPRIRTTLQKLHLTPGTPPSVSAHRERMQKSTKSFGEGRTCYDLESLVKDFNKKMSAAFGLSAALLNTTKLLPVRAAALVAPSASAKKGITLSSSRLTGRESGRLMNEVPGLHPVPYLKHYHKPAQVYLNGEFQRLGYDPRDTYFFPPRGEMRMMPNLDIWAPAQHERDLILAAEIEETMERYRDRLIVTMFGVDVMLPLDPCTSSGKKAEETLPTMPLRYGPLYEDFLEVRSSGTMWQETLGKNEKLP